MADRSPADPTLLPPRRFGTLLAATRDASGRTLGDLTGGDAMFGPAELESYERGMGLVDDETAAALCEIYGIEPGTLAPQRSRLIIDVAETEVLFVAYPGERERFAADGPTDVLARYLGLVYTLRGVKPARELPIRDGDIAALAEALQLGEATISRQLRVLIDSAATAGYRSAFGRRFLVPAAGVVVALCSAGGLILVAAARGDGASGTREATPLAGDLASRPAGDEGPDPRPPGMGLDAASVGSPITETRRTAPSDPPATPAPAAPSTSPPSRVSPTTAPAPTPTTPQVAAPPATDPSITQPSATQPPPAALQVTTPPAPSVGQAALEGIGFDWQTLLPGWTIEIKPAQSSLRGATFPYERRIEIYERGDDTVGGLTHVIAHEIGHGIDVSRLDAAARTAWLVARGAIGADWWTSVGANDFAVGSGDFAESFAVRQTGANSRSHLGGAPTRAQIDVLIDLISP